MAINHYINNLLECSYPILIVLSESIDCQFINNYGSSSASSKKKEKGVRHGRGLRKGPFNAEAKGHLPSEALSLSILAGEAEEGGVGRLLAFPCWRNGVNRTFPRSGLHVG